MLTNEPKEEIIPRKQQYFVPIQAKIIELLKEHKTMTRDDICRAFGFEKHKVEYIYHPNRVQRRGIKYISLEQYDRRSTIYDNLRKLQKQNIIEKFSYNNGQRGRPLVYWQLRDDIS